MKYFLILLKYDNARVLHLIKLPFMGVALFIKKVKDSTSDNTAYSFGITISILWFQQIMEFVLWENWKI